MQSLAIPCEQLLDCKEYVLLHYYTIFARAACKDIWYLVNKQTIHSLAAPHEHFCAKLLSDYKEFDPECFLALLHNIARAACKDIWYFMYTFSKEFIRFRHEKCASEHRIF